MSEENVIIKKVKKSAHKGSHGGSWKRAMKSPLKKGQMPASVMGTARRMPMRASPVMSPEAKSSPFLSPSASASLSRVSTSAAAFLAALFRTFTAK